MKTSTTLLFFTLLFTSVEAQKVEIQFQEILDSMFVSHPETIGIMVHVESPINDISWSGAVGHAEKGKEKEIAPDQPALIASNTKTFVSAAILQLQAQNKLTIHQSIKTYLPNATTNLLEKNLYKVDSIKIENLMSHTSGIPSFANDAYMKAIVETPEHRWTRNEQIEWAMNSGPPLGFPGSVFKYSDTNYLLLTEIIEEVTGQPFYTAMRELLEYEANGFHTIWFPTLEDKPSQSKERVHQYSQSLGKNSFELDVSVDLYGGGGIACSTADLAKFYYRLFNGEIVKNQEVLNLIYNDYNTRLGDNHYHLGISDYEINGHLAYAHTGFWGTVALYVPELDLALSVYVLENTQRTTRSEVVKALMEVIENHTKGK